MIRYILPFYQGKNEEFAFLPRIYALEYLCIIVFQLKFCCGFGGHCVILVFRCLMRFDKRFPLILLIMFQADLIKERQLMFETYFAMICVELVLLFSEPLPALLQKVANLQL